MFVIVQNMFQRLMKSNAHDRNARQGCGRGCSASLRGYSESNAKLSKWVHPPAQRRFRGSREKKNCPIIEGSATTIARAHCSTGMRQGPMISGTCSPLRRFPDSLVLPLLHMSINVDPSVKLCINLFLVFNGLFY